MGAPIRPAERPCAGLRPQMSDLSEWLVGSCETFRAFEEQLRRVAASEATVLVTGESGSGKGRAARALHALGPRHDGPLVTVSLAALAPTLVESELFGHERGAFTDATSDRAGCFRRAHGGTLVLDDVDLLPREAQVKLLRVLQERVVEPLGAEDAVPIDVRVVATSARDLRAAVETGELREDLYFRLAVVPLHVPPLRARIEDLVPLVAHLARRAAARLGVPPRPFSGAALDRLRAHAWPGNVRELENAVERTLVLAPPNEGAVPTPVAAQELAFLDEVANGVARELARDALAHGMTVEALERALLEQALEDQRGNVSAAARQVGLTRRAFEYRLGKRDRDGEDADAADEADEADEVGAS